MMSEFVLLFFLLPHKSKIVAVLFKDCTAKFSNMACVFLPKNETNISKSALLFLDIFKIQVLFSSFSSAELQNK